MKPYVTQVDLSLARKLKADLTEKGFEFSKPAYSLFSAKKPGLSCTLYESGKLVIQGKNMAEFIEFYIEPELTLDFAKSIDTTERIGSDETGKGDFFGPLCVAAVYVRSDSFSLLEEIGVRDSKSMSDLQIIKIAKQIEKKVPHHIVQINPQKYNELYDRFKNLNTLLAWAHATAIEKLVEKTGCRRVIVDQFAKEFVLQHAIDKKGICLDLIQRHRGEEDIVVAAASILARKCFVSGMEALEKKYDLKLPKGASAKTISAAKAFVKRYGKEHLHDVAKMHFKTVQKVLY